MKDGGRILKETAGWIWDGLLEVFERWLKKSGRKYFECNFI